MSTIQKYLTKDGNTKSPGVEKNKKQGTKEKKKDPGKQKGDLSDKSREDINIESQLESSKMEEQRINAQIPTKMEMIEMFAKLENSIKRDCYCMDRLGPVVEAIGGSRGKNRKTGPRNKRAKNTSKKLASGEGKLYLNWRTRKIKADAKT